MSSKEAGREFDLEKVNPEIWEELSRKDRNDLIDFIAKKFYLGELSWEQALTLVPDNLTYHLALSIRRDEWEIFLEIATPYVEGRISSDEARQVLIAKHGGDLDQILIWSGKLEKMIAELRRGQIEIKE